MSKLGSYDDIVPDKIKRNLQTKINHELLSSFFLNFPVKLLDVEYVNRKRIVFTYTVVKN